MRLTLPLLSASLLLAACASGGASGSVPGSAPASSSSDASTVVQGTTRVMLATLVPTNASGNRITGRIRLLPTSNASEMTADIDIRGGAYQNKYGWEVRAGQCGDNGQALGTVMAYPLIETRADGMAQMKRPVKITIPEGQVHHVAVFASAARGQIVSCGVLSPEG
jgi:hypothetical protein